MVRLISSFIRIEWWGKVEGDMPNPDVEYPALPTAATFAGVNQHCSLPVFDKKDTHPIVDALYGRHEKDIGEL